MFDKYYFEEYARLSLTQIILEISNHFSHEDSPDLKSWEDSIGIEVTIAISQQIAENESYGSKWLGKKASDTVLSRYNGEFFVRDGRILAYSPTKGAITLDAFKEIAAAVSKKTEKIERYREDFKTVGLYVFCLNSFADEINTERIRCELLDDFDFITINTADMLFVVSKNNTIANQQSPVTREQMVFYKDEALRLSCKKC